MANLACSSSSGRLRLSEAGATAIEFAIVFPVLIMMLGAILETGSFLVLQNQLQLATDSAARQILIGKVGPARRGSSEADQRNITEFKALVCSGGGLRLDPCEGRISVDIRSGETFAAIAAVMPNPATDVGKTASTSSYTETYDPGAPGMAGSLIVTYDWEFTFPGIGLLFGNVATFPGIRRIVATAVFKNEGR